MKEKILIYGAGLDSELINSSIIKEYDLIGFLDDSMGNTYRMYDNKYKVFKPWELQQLSFDKVIIGNRLYATEMFSQLLVMGIRENNIILDYVSNEEEVETSNLFLHQFENNKCYREDIIVKFLGIEGYFENNNQKINLYRNNQKRRLKLSAVAEEEDWHRFTELIESFDKEGYKNIFHVKCDQNYKVMDGAHRVACALFFKVKEMMVNVIPGKFDINYSIDWYIRNNFSGDELLLIQNKEQQLFSFFLTK